jgi:CoA:oxalate CoA-transferase
VSWGVENQWELFCALIGTPELINDERFDTPHARTANHAELEPLLNAALMRKTTAEWVGEFDQIGLPCGPLNNIAQAAALPQVQAREMLVEVEHPQIGKLPLANTPVKLSRTPGGVKGTSPALGQHTDDVLRGLLGMSDDEIERLRAAGVVT